jgi:broad specificity phosphatase PhoE
MQLVPLQLGPDETIYVYVSPYMRTMQTLYEMGETFGTDRILGVREEPRMREQDFGRVVTPGCQIGCHESDVF